MDILSNELVTQRATRLEADTCAVKRLTQFTHRVLFLNLMILPSFDLQRFRFIGQINSEDYFGIGITDRSGRGGVGQSGTYHQGGVVARHTFHRSIPRPDIAGESVSATSLYGRAHIG